MNGCERYLDVVKRLCTVQCDLHLFVSFAGDEDNVTRLRYLTGKLDSALAVWLDGEFCARLCPSQPYQGIMDDAQRIFAPRVVRSQDDEVAARRGRFRHERTLQAVTVTATPEERDDTPLRGAGTRGEISRDRGQIAQSVVRVCVVND